MCGIGGWCISGDPPSSPRGYQPAREPREAVLPPANVEVDAAVGNRHSFGTFGLFPGSDFPGNDGSDGQDPAMSTPIILDCDPGIDDALAIAFATASPEIDLVGITTVAGNVGLDKTTANGLAVASFVGAKDVPVTPGAAAPLLRPALHAGHVHGDSGLGGAVLPPPVRAVEDGHAIDYIIGTIGAAPGEITLVATGPLTNIGLALRREPRLATWVKDFVIMGGSAG